MKTLGDGLKNAREKKNLTQIDVSKRIGINNKTISNYKNNVSSPYPETLKIFADLYEVSADYIIGRTEYINFKNTETEYPKRYLDVSGLSEEVIDQIKEYVEFMRQRHKQESNPKKK